MRPHAGGFAVTSAAQCDCCGTVLVGSCRRYPCDDYEFRYPVGTGDVVITLPGAWVVCRRCARLVQQGRWEALALRTLAKYEQIAGGFTPERRLVMRTASPALYADLSRRLGAGQNVRVVP